MSLPTLSAHAITDIRYVINLLHGPGNDLERPDLGDEANELISRNYVSLGYTSQVTLNEALRDKPKQTLLRVIRYLADGTAPSA
jgi:hypothetical protein